MKYTHSMILLALAVLLLMPAGMSLAQSNIVGLGQITNDREIDLYPDISPDGAFIAYMSYQKEGGNPRNFNIIVQNLKSGELQRLDSDAAEDAFPVWSADGAAIFFDAYRRVDMRAVWRKQISGGLVQKVTNIPKAAFNADSHPDGKRIVFNAWDRRKDVTIERDGSYWMQWKRDMPNILIINSDGSNLIDLNVQGINPKWSPDGQFITYASNTTGNYEIYIMRGDGSDRVPLTAREAVDVEPAWSPDGRFVVFTSNENRNWNLWMVKPDGTGLSQITSHERFEGGPMWAVDGYIYFHSDNNGNWDIWRLKPAGYEPIPADKDGDGIANKDENCPDDAEDMDGFEDADGCPDVDNDQDGILDVEDKDCPNDAEDKDGFEDEDGCPDVDNDKDNVLDADEKNDCLNIPETANFFQDEDGCPDEAPVNNGQVLSLTFPIGSAAIRGDANIEAMINLLNGLKQMPKAKMTIKVYTDSNSHRANPRLTEKRAEAIRDYLLQKGVDPQQIYVLGMGDNEPQTENSTAAGRARNNRVVVEVRARNGI